RHRALAAIAALLTFARSGRQVFGVTRGGLYNLGAELTAGGVDNGDRFAGLVVAHAGVVRPFLPFGAQRVALSLPCCRVAEQRVELAPSDHSIASSARASSVGGMARPSALAVARLMTKSSLVGNSIGRSPARAPFKILST